MYVKKRISRAVLALILMLGIVLNAIPVWAGSTSSVWTAVSPPPTANNLKGVTYGNGIYIAIGSSGTILASSSGTDNWVSHNSGTTDLNGVACGVDDNGNTLFAAVGNNGAILTSSDGSAWNSRTSGTAANLNGITYGGGQFVAVGDGGTILTSPNGEVWEAKTDGSGNPYTGENLYSATFGKNSNGKDILVVAGSNGTILSFLGLYDWSYNSIYSDSSTDSLYGIAFGWDSNGDPLFVATGGNGKIFTSSDAQIWTSQTSGTTQNVNGINYNGRQFIAVGSSGTILVSADGAAWTQQTSGTAISLYGVTCGTNYYVAMGQNGTILYYALAAAAGAATITSVSDIGSNGNGSDLEVSFNKAADESQVSEYRIMVVPVNNANNFNLIKANTVPAGNYTTVNKTGSNQTVVLLAAACDTDGSLLENDSTYKVFILSVADGTNTTVNALSGASSGITLRMWNWANPRPTGNTLKGAAYGNGLYVAVGDSGTILTSPDGTNWTNRTFDTTYNLNGVAYGKGIFVAVGASGTAFTSPDGIRWSCNSDASNILDLGAEIYGVAYGKGFFVAVCSDGKILTSPDGVNWIKRQDGANSRAVAYGNGYFAAVGNNGKIMTSPDGRTWTSITNSGTPYTTENFYGITYGSGFVSVGTNGLIMYSSTGASWTSTTASFDYMGSTYPVDSTITAVTYGNGRYLSMVNGIILTSPDGATWTASLSAPSANTYGLAYGNSLFLAAGDNGIITLSPDGAIWTRRSSGTVNYIKGVVYDGSRFIAVGNGVTLDSADGASWDSHSIAADYGLNGITYGKNGDNMDIYVAVGSNGYPNGDKGIIMTSANGTTWDLFHTRSNSNTPLASVAYGNGTFVAVGRNDQSSGDYGVILTSTDGSNWSSQGDGSTAWTRLCGVAYGSGRFEAVGYNGIILSSTNGTNWTVTQSASTNFADTLNGISYVNNTFVAVGNGGRIIFSGDGDTWNTLTDSRATSQFYGVTYNNGVYVAVGESGTVRTSTDLTNWAFRGCDPGTKSIFYGISQGKGVYVAVGSDGTILMSGTVITAAPTTVNTANNTVSVSPASITAGSSATITATGDRQSVVGAVYGDERYIPTTWSSTEAGKNGTFTVTGSTYASSYTPSSAGSYTITATFQKQTWDGSAWNNVSGSTDIKTTSMTVTAASAPTAANAASNTISASPASVTVGGSTTITAVGDRQSVAGAVYGDERYIPTAWTSTEAGKNGTFTLSGGNYTSSYTPSTTGSYTITATFQKQTWDGSAWNNVSGSTDIKTTSMTVTAASAPTAANAANNTVSVNPASVTAGSSTTITAAGDRQSAAGSVTGDERYVPTTWTSTEAGKNGTFTVTGSVYTSSYTPSSAGSYTITATFQKQTWNESAWNNAVGSTDTKTVPLTVNSSGGGNGGGGSSGGSSSTGNTTTAGTSQTGLGSITVENGTATATVDSAKLAKEISGNKPGSTIVLAITGNVNKADFNLTVADLKAIADNGSMLQLESPMGIYKLPATEIDFDSISKQYPNIGYKDIKVTVAFSKADGNNAILNGSKLAGQPVNITVSLVAGDKVIELDEFTKYVERDLPVPDGSGFTTGVVIEKDGTLRPVPTKTVTINGKKYAAIFSRTNSIYALASKSVSFDDMKGHWAREAVNDLASRLIINGVGNNSFTPGRDITRAEFAAIVVRALGLKVSNGVGFTDVKSGSWYYGAVAAAYKYGIVSGYGDGTFKPDSKITRQEAMAMIARAMKVAGMDTTITNEAAAAELAKFIDGGNFSDWAKQPAAAVIRSGLVVGSEGYTRPERNITRAETSAIVRRLLEKAGLI
ncbi:MAG: S-layer homology domain-containing protein [Eubacteriales bacterium]